MIFNPFPGLRPFQADEDHLFFGREKEIDEALRRLRSNRFLSIVGTSGSGKSSLVRCGLISALYGGFMAQTGSAWRIAIFRPSDDPIRNLARSLGDPAVLGLSGESVGTNRALVEATLRRGTLGLAQAYRQARLAPDENLLIVVDQFEELFRFRRNRQILNAEDDAVAFVKLLLEGARADLPIYIITTMRSDFIGDCMEYPGLPEAINAGQYLIPRMTRDEIRSAITGPVAVGGGQIAQRLVLRLLNDLGDDQDQLPVLQHALMRSWDYWASHRQGNEPIDISHYETVGTMRHALSLHAEEAFDDVPSERGKQVVERMFRSLTDTFSDPRGVRRPTSVKRLAEICEASEAEIIEFVDIFRAPGRSFLTPQYNVPLDSRTVIDISHESLMRCWTRLIDWAKDEKASATFYVRLAQAATWFQEGAAGLWHDPELEFGLRWREQNHPTEAWAGHYPDLCCFTTVMEFLDRSRDARDTALAEKEQTRKRQLRQYQWAAAVLALLLVIVGILGYIARKANLQASENFSLAQNAVDEMLSSAGRREARVAADAPELEEFRAELLDKARAFYTRFVRIKPDSLALRKEMAEAHFRLGDIERILARPDAAEQYAAAIDGFKALLTYDPRNPVYQQSLAKSYNWLGETLRATPGKETDADRAYGGALELQEQLVRERRADPTYQQELARTHYNRGIVRYNMGRPADSEADFRAAVQLLVPLAAKELDSTARQELGRVYNDLGNLVLAQDRLPEAHQFYQDAIEIHEQLAKQQPSNREIKQELATFSDNLSIVLMYEKTFDSADSANQNAVNLFEELAAPSPSLGLELAKSHAVRCRILLSRSPVDAQPECDTALNVLESLRRKQSTPTDAPTQKLFRDLAYDYWDIAKASVAPQLQSQRAHALLKLSVVLPQVPEPYRSELAKSSQN